MEKDLLSIKYSNDQQKAETSISLISIIIPTLNEELNIRKTLSQFETAKTATSIEVIVVDGGSEDSTCKIVESFDFVRLIKSDRGRGTQLKTGADTVKGDILFFLHADCIVPENFFTLIQSAFSPDIAQKFVAGVFDIQIDSPFWIYRIIEAAANLRSRLTGIPYGDQGLFVKKETYQDIGGFSTLPIMEDIEIAMRLKKKGNILFLKNKLTVSARRWQKEGVFYATVRNWILALSFVLLKVPPYRLAKHYKNER